MDPPKGWAACWSFFNIFERTKVSASRQVRGDGVRGSVLRWCAGWGACAHGSPPVSIVGDPCGCERLAPLASPAVKCAGAFN
eukprot:scaffold9487_cov105-Isochrysis_galbana.AAC.6